MPAVSTSQRKFFNLALDVKKGDKPRSEVSQSVLDVVDSMSTKEIKDFAKTKGNLSKKKEHAIKLKPLIENILNENDNKEEIERLTADINDLKERVNSLNDKKARIDKNISRVQKRISSFNEKIAKLKEEDTEEEPEKERPENKN